MSSKSKKHFLQIKVKNKLKNLKMMP